VSRWEYLTIELKPKYKDLGKVASSIGMIGEELSTQSFDEQLNIYGSKGWELVTIYRPPTGGIFKEDNIFATFKRPI